MIIFNPSQVMIMLGKVTFIHPCSTTIHYYPPTPAAFLSCFCSCSTTILLLLPLHYYLAHASPTALFSALTLPQLPILSTHSILLSRHIYIISIHVSSTRTTDHTYWSWSSIPMIMSALQHLIMICMHP